MSLQCKIGARACVITSHGAALTNNRKQGIPYDEIEIDKYTYAPVLSKISCSSTTYIKERGSEHNLKNIHY